MMRARALGVAGVAVLLALAAAAQAHDDPGPAAGDRTTGARASRPGPHQDGVQPTVTLKLSVTGRRVSTGATATIRGTFRGRAVAGRQTYRLLPVGAATAIHRHGTGAAHRARIEEAFLDARSGDDFMRVVGSGSLIGGPLIAGRRGACRRVAFRHSVRPEAGTAVLRWACRRDDDLRSPPIHVDVFERPRDTIASSYTIVRRPCVRRPATLAVGDC